jgi:hypothetical protein
MGILFFFGITFFASAAPVAEMSCIRHLVKAISAHHANQEIKHYIMECVSDKKESI